MNARIKKLLQNQESSPRLDFRQRKEKEMKMKRPLAWFRTAEGRQAEAEKMSLLLEDK